MRGLFKRLSEFKTINVAKFLSSSPTNLSISCDFRSKILFHPGEFTTSSTRRTKSFFKYALRSRLLLNFVSRSRSKFFAFHFFNIQNSTFKFRKRSNMYFYIGASSTPSNSVVFLTGLPELLGLIIAASSRLLKVYGLRAGILKFRVRSNTVDIYLLNTHLIVALLNNKKIDHKDHILKLSVRTSSQTLVQSLFYSVFKKRLIYK